MSQMISFRKVFIIFVCLLSVQTALGGWTKQNANTLAWLRDIHFFDENRGIVVGSGGTLLYTRDGGKNWTKRKNFTTDNILQIYFSDASTGWLLCERDPYSRGANAVSYLMKTTDGGANWEKIEFRDAGRTRVTKIFFDRKGNGFAVGESGAFFESRVDGAAWEKSPSPVRYLLLDGAFSDDSNAVVVGAGGSLYFTENAGANWNQANVSGKVSTKLNAVFFVDRRNGWAVGAGGKILQSMNGGKTWREQNSGVGGDLRGVYFRNSAEGWAAGDDGTLLHTETGGNVWTTQETKVKHRLEKVIFTGKKGFAIGFGGTILAYPGADY